MERDNLDKFINSHRDNFDVYDAPPFAWDAIETQLPSKSRGRFFMLKIAAIGLVLFIAGLGLGSFFTNGGNTSMASALPAELLDIEQYYGRQVNATYKELQTLGMDTKVQKDLQSLDEIYEELKEELLYSELQNKEQIMNAMIRNYQTKTELLQRILDKVKRNEAIKNINKNELIEI